MPGAVNSNNPNIIHPTQVDRTGALGVTVTTDTSLVTGDTWYAIQVLEDAVFSTFTESGVSGQAMTGFTVPAGMTIYGVISAYQLSSGKVRAYKE